MVPLVSAFHRDKATRLTLLNDCDLSRDRLAANFRFQCECQQIQFSFRIARQGLAKSQPSTSSLVAVSYIIWKKYLVIPPSQTLNSWVPNRRVRPGFLNDHILGVLILGLTLPPRRM
ncbi:hypothetical protein RU07_23680 [Agrobacterium tumefaciens]|uniref:Uncharacterized protein n=1 Tax=Agrobacterium tumefaciens TaxID=358 RepID=A0A0D0JQI9_AGRTU|nr:hypothetical protein RU07_23680 [Agrobacterium tumefaciens]